MNAGYRTFLEAKVRQAPFAGFEIDRDELHPWLKPHIRAIVPWMLRGGRRALFASFGLAKTSAQLELMRLIKKHKGGHTLIVLPLGVRQEFRRDAETMGVSVKFIRRAEEIEPDVTVHLTNYESVRDGKLDPSLFTAASLDEASVLRDFGSKTYQEFLPLFAGVPFRFVATATPSPNRFKELIHYAGFLGVMDTGQALTRFFQRDSEKAGNLTLYPHKEEEFWNWVHSWALFVQRPSDLGFSDEGYDLPPLTVRWHEIASDHGRAGVDRDGQGLLLRDAAMGVTQAAAEKRDSLNARIEKMLEITREDPEPHRILWHDLEAERWSIEKALPSAVSVYGILDLDERERRVLKFADGEIKYLATKPEISGSGCNFQRHCHKAVFLGIGFKFNDFIQACHRIRRFGQPHICEIDIIYTEAEREVRRSLESKWQRDTEMRERMSDIVRRYGLDVIPDETLTRSIGVARAEKRGGNYAVVNADCIEETARMAENSVDLIVTSIPFANHYEYTPLYNDFGHTDDNAHFWAQMDYLSPQLFRVLNPGRLCCIHVKDRVLFGNVTGAGLPTVSPFHAEAIFHYRKHGFDYCGMITVVTDVVRENNQTYRLGWSEHAKDGTKMGVGCPEYVLLLHKPQSNRSKSYADVPVTHEKPLCLTQDGRQAPFNKKLPPIPGTGYSRARWQIDAHAFWRSSGDRLLSAEELASYPPSVLAKLFTRESLKQIYDYERHVQIGEQLESRFALPTEFMSLAPGSNDPMVWHDINRMRTLNSAQSLKGRELHVCPLQLDIIERLIRRYSNPGETVLDPFGGIMSVPYSAIRMERRGIGIELHSNYWRDGIAYCEQAEREIATPTLFAIEQAAAEERDPDPPIGDL